MFVVRWEDRRIKEFGDAELSEHVIELHRAIETLQTRALEATGEHDVRALWAIDGCATAPQWLSQNTELGPAEAAGHMWLSRRLRRDMPVTREALGEGTVSVAKAKVLAHAVNDRTRAVFGEHEAVLVGEAKRLNVKDLQRAVNHWKLRADQDGPVPAAEKVRARRNLFFHQLPDGTWKIDGLLDPESGAIGAELRRICDLYWRADQADSADPDRPSRTSTQRRADALVDMARRSAAHDRQAAAQPTILVRMDLESLLGGEGEASLIDGDIPIPAETARRLACDASLVRFVIGTDGELLDLGRTARTASPGQRRALIARDGSYCVVPGCDMPHHFCQAHHLVWWDRGGVTDLSNMGMVCHRHHHMLHEGGWTLTREPGVGFIAHPPRRC